MKQSASVNLQSNGFDRKNEQVELIRHGSRPERTFISTEDLEAMRTERVAVPASKHGLEVICGASCETGAQ
jgi:hypothetical protein